MPVRLLIITPPERSSMTNPPTPIGDGDMSRNSSLRRMPVIGPNPAAANRRLLNSVEGMLVTRDVERAHPRQQPAAENRQPVQPPAPRVLCIDDDSEYIDALQIRLQSQGIDV